MSSLASLTPLLAIETSCDDTACAILDAQGHILGESVLSQESHAALGGVVPEIAARAHLDILPEIVDLTLKRAGLTLDEIALFAATIGPGLIGGLIVGSSYAKGLAMAQNKPFMGINHIEGHILVPRLPNVLAEDIPSLNFPYLALLVSGGHCQCVSVEETGHYRLLGGTIDDAAGEAFDKVAKMLGLGWPGGPALEKLAREGNDMAFSLPRPLKGRDGCNFSFSGLKTAVARLIAPYGNGALPRQIAADIAASFQRAVADVMEDRAEHALLLAPTSTALVVAGGVAANHVLRERLKKVAQRHDIPFLAPPLRLCTDNAVMIGWAALERLAQGEYPDDSALAPRPRWPLAERQPYRPLPMENAQ
ncbi:tRNA (adenosine(37)-N6)-threonylcarbamoyltransferase complex transferase subunit TsaD [Saccharibacter sp. 17.LH.SD]|uniref:tRNA (adenosine(37)-N6)-threonylcarbamoyltransferase complex transferase subunit TsaD n=1 Tax=Saccharibacter sp. 17.LH.SD TaxID=2689393 RepID=UPI00136A0C26|nr:tRNA (adenosine(37)-N6)-threonylcarbamoyltransferase complex transferase subunit TsaD [Saccharibacter sp. 17.LH.SD]MXV44147.1 tRNA (adenosine(37)-N6)-threonylcarbamoyltransferase complex transferase subunit TsaD [Saccharibacter sp. 17.LH.SD]